MHFEGFDPFRHAGPSQVPHGFWGSFYLATCSCYMFNIEEIYSFFNDSTGLAWAMRRQLSITTPSTISSTTNAPPMK